MDFKEIIANKISDVINIDANELKNYIEVPKDNANGDYSFPCFRLAKDLRKSPMDIATMIKYGLVIDGVFEKVDVISGFLNFYIDKSIIVKSFFDKFNANENYGSTDIGKGKIAIVEYSSPNIAKPFHIGHLKNTVIGHALDNLYRFQGYNVISWNHLGDYGTQFAKLIEAYKRWGNEYDLNENPIKKLAEMYVRINQLCAEDESVLEESRETFKQLEDGNPEYVKLRDEFTKYSMIDFNKIYDLLGVKFDKIIGESFYIDKIPAMYEVLEKTLDYLNTSEDNRKNYLLLLYFLYTVIKEEGISIEGGIDELQFEIPEQKKIDLDKTSRKILEYLFEDKLKIVINDENFELNSVKKAILVLENYINFNLDTNINAKKMLWGALLW